MMITRATCVFLLLFHLILVSRSSGKLTDLMKTCEDVSCPVKEKNSPDAGGKNFKWLTSGLVYLFWRDVRSGNLFVNDSIISLACREQLMLISAAIGRNEQWAYAFPDASGKASPGLLLSTVTSYGDYDQCLGIDSSDHKITGKYCMLDMHHARVKQQEQGKLYLSNISMIRGQPQSSGLCVPDACDGYEIQQAVHRPLTPYSIHTAGHVHCDTKQSVSYSERLGKLSMLQVASIILISTLVILVLSCTLIHAYSRMSQPLTLPGLVTSLSAITSCREIFYAKPWSFEILVFDLLKTNIIVIGTLAHIWTGVETPLSFATIGNQRTWHKISLPLLQNDAGLLGLPFLTGYASFAMLYPMARRGRLPFKAAILDRVIRFMPPLLVLTACEFIWPILGSGPFYTRVSEFNLAKCEKNWFYNLLFVNNFINSIDICSGHSYWSAVDMQLFLVGLIAVYIFSKSETAGVWFSVLLMAAGVMKTTYNSIMYDTGFSLLDVEPDGQKMVNYFHYIHMPTSSYLAPYVAGILIAFARMNGRLIPDLPGVARKTLFYLLVWVAFLAVNYNDSIVESYAPEQKWLFILINRTFQLLGNILMFTFFMSLKDWWEESYGQRWSQMGETFSPFKALSRLCFPLYICNYLYIRMEFFSRRFLMSGGGFWIFKRTLSTFIIVYLFTIAYHLFLLVPLELIISIVSKRTKNNDERSKQK